MRHVTARGVDWQVEDIALEGNPWRFWDDWERLDFEPHTLEVVDRFVTPGSTMIDVGAWNGVVSLWASRNGARVVACEPDPTALKCLQVNVDANHANVDIFAGALSDHTGVCHIQADPQGWGSSMTRVMDVGTEVPCLTMPDLFDIYDIERCALVKMDCEGAEAVILEHAAPFLAAMGIPLWVSMHEPWWPKPLSPRCFDLYGTVTGSFSGFGQVLALP